FAVLEGFASGMPVVSTDVGSCSELVFGRDGEHPPLGAAGKIVPTGNPSALGKALASLLNDRSLQERLGAAGLARTERYYSEPGVIGDYRNLYQSLMTEAISATA
ncbi:MAG: glycosyltransferase, partial [Verrucomicrobiae bacterium]|nr:glycosyltransferase [Verrucomicrobiae bacterium]